MDGHGAADPVRGIPADRRGRVERIARCRSAEVLSADAILAERLHEDAGRLAERLWRYTGEAGTPDDGWTFDSLCERLTRAGRNHQDADEILRRWDREYDIWRRGRAEARGRAYIDRHFDFSRFERLFPVARGMGRRLVLVVGPTNSGKTHRALEALRDAPPGSIWRRSGCWRWRFRTG